jgi:hypothetical protein
MCVHAYTHKLSKFKCRFVILLCLADDIYAIPLTVFGSVIGLTEMQVIMRRRH